MFSAIHSRLLLSILHQETSDLSKLHRLPCLQTFLWVPLLIETITSKFLSRAFKSMDGKALLFSLLSHPFPP